MKRILCERCEGTLTKLGKYWIHADTRRADCEPLGSGGATSPKAKYLVTNGMGDRFEYNSYARALAKWDFSHMQHLYELDAHGQYQQIG